MVDEFACPHCGKNLGSSMEPPGTTLMCPYCKQFFTIAAGLQSTPPRPAHFKSDRPEPVKPSSPELKPPPPQITAPVPPAPAGRTKLTRPSCPYLIPDLPRSSSQTAGGYIVICGSILGLLIALALAVVLILAKLVFNTWELEIVEIIQLLLPEKLHPHYYLVGAVAASFLGVFNLIWLWAGIGLLKEKKSARVVLWLLGILVLLILIAVLCLGYIYRSKISGTGEIP